MNNAMQCKKSVKHQNKEIKLDECKDAVQIGQKKNYRELKAIENK